MSGYLGGGGFFSSYEDVPRDSWKWFPEFTPSEIACKGTGNLLIVPHALDALLRARRSIGKPFIILSGYRSVSHNRACGGASGSQHLLGTAFDISLAGHQVPNLLRALLVSFGSFGLYPNFVHVDTRVGKWWVGDWSYPSS